MPLEPTDYYRTHLATLHRQLVEHEVTKAYLTGTDIRYDGANLTADDSFELPFGVLSTLEFAHLFSVFDGSRVHQQVEKHPSLDDAPPGMYFTVINTNVIQNLHKNKAGLIVEEVGTTGLFIEGLHIDHFFLNKHKTPSSLGTFTFTLCAITAHMAGLSHISLIAAGGKGFDPRHIGFKIWPKLGFDAELLPGETDNAPQLHACETVQQVCATDSDWWEANGSQRRMTFDLNADSISWRKLLSYAGEKASTGDSHG